MSDILEIPWLTDLDEARTESNRTGKPILMFFHYEHCAGSRSTIENTLPKMSVTDMVTESFVPVILDVTEQNELVKEYGVDWTPTFVVTDEHGVESDRWVGYLPEDDYMGQLHMALARHALRKQDYKDAERRFGDVVLRFPLTDLAPEAMYYHGVSRFRLSGDSRDLSRTCDDLREAYPESVWAFKASAWTPDSLAKAA